MIDITQYEDLLDENAPVKVIDKYGDEYRGKLLDWTSAADNEPDPESITLACEGGELREIFVQDIESITPLNKG